MRDTKFQHEITMAFFRLHTQRLALAAVADECLPKSPAAWNDDDYAWPKPFWTAMTRATLSAIKEDLAETYGADRVDDAILARPLDSEVHPYDPAQRRYVSGSTDVGEWDTPRLP
jgi:aminobenzoyl-glutamate utilization protein B